MKTKIIIASGLFLSFIGTSNAALSVISEPINDSQVKVQVVSDSSDKVENVNFKLGYDPTLQVSSLENGNLLSNGTPTQEEGAITYTGDTSTSEVGSGVVASFILERPAGTDVTESMVALESAAVNGTDLSETDLSSASSTLTYGAVTSTTPVVADNTTDNTGNRGAVSVTRASTTTKTGAQENVAIMLGLLSLLAGTVYFKRKAV